MWRRKSWLRLTGGFERLAAPGRPAPVGGGGRGGRGATPEPPRAAPGVTETALAPVRPPALPVAGGGGAEAGMVWPSMRMSCPHLRHFMRSVRPDAFSSAIWYFALQLPQRNFM